jgi:hypothetical protein
MKSFTESPFSQRIIMLLYDKLLRLLSLQRSRRRQVHEQFVEACDVGDADRAAGRVGEANPNNSSLTVKVLTSNRARKSLEDATALHNILNLPNYQTKYMNIQRYWMFRVFCII